MIEKDKVGVVHLKGIQYFIDFSKKHDVQGLTKGYIVIDVTGGLCYGRRVCNGEKKVYVKRVLDLKVVYGVPQDGHETNKLC